MEAFQDGSFTFPSWDINKLKRVLSTDSLNRLAPHFENINLKHKELVQEYKHVVNILNENLEHNLMDGKNLTPVNLLPSADLEPNLMDEKNRISNTNVNLPLEHNLMDEKNLISNTNVNLLSSAEVIDTYGDTTPPYDVDENGHYVIKDQDGNVIYSSESSYSPTNKKRKLSKSYSV